MSTTVYAIDPDVWKTSTNDQRCRLAILDIWEKPENQNSHAIALDGSDLENEYIDMLLSDSINTDLRKILQDIFNQRERNSQRIYVIKPELPPKVQKIINHHNCQTPVEPTLIGMAASPNSPNLTLLLSGSDALRKRGLHQKGVQRDIRRFFRSHLHKSLTVLLASDIGIPKRNELVAGLHSRIFEDQVRSIWQQRIFEKYRSMPCFRQRTPGQVERHQSTDNHRAGEIDGYLFLAMKTGVQVWICECELREEGNEHSLTTEDKVSKLVRKIEGVRAFEQSNRYDFVNVKGFLITNAVAMSQNAQQMAVKNNIQYVYAKMPEGWTENYHWQLRDDYLNRIEL